MSAVSAQWIEASLSASETSASVWIEPQARKLKRVPTASIRPQPVLRRPGSTPRMRIAPLFMECLLYEKAADAPLYAHIRSSGLLVRRHGAQLLLDGPQCVETLPNVLPPIARQTNETRSVRPVRVIGKSAASSSAPFSLTK